VKENDEGKDKQQYIKLANKPIEMSGRDKKFKALE